MDQIISEKRLEYRQRLGIEINFSVENAYGLCIKVSSVNFKRLISNIINNSIEATSKNGIISVGIRVFEEDFVDIIIQDNGKGIPTEMLEKLGQRGASFNKEGGSGLGLFHAKKSIESWGGKLLIQSALDRGTTITLRLPREQQPRWLCSKLLVSEKAQIAILDDDHSIHHTWNERFKHVLSVESVHFTSADDFKKCKIENMQYFLMDYELIGSKETGLDLIEAFKLQDKSILVTSYFEDENILNRCQHLGVSIIPKALVGCVPIEVA
ncbi:MAG: hypothetical protein HY072_06660 [Deltaproteobacteria bacterium]|nr:hypothetical protein [Deltaproteobacteria bacterium]